jgi:hypothetical protein
MAEYAGYVKRGTPINWGTVANDLVKKIGNVEKEQAAFREKYDSIAAKTSAEIGKYEAGQSPQLNDLAYNMIADGRTTLSALHEKLKRREISPDAFNRAAMSMQTQNQEFKTMLNTYNANVADLEKGISDGTLSSLSDFQLDVYQDISDLSNKKFQWASNPDGITNLYVNTIDKDGNPVKQPMSLSSIRDMGNMRYEKYDIDTNLAKSIKSLGVYDINNISDARNNPQYSKWKESLINDATVGDRAATILADYGDFVPYKQGDDIPKDKDGNDIGIEMLLKPNGQYEPNITPELRNKAKTIVDESIEARVGRTESIDYQGQRLELAKEKKATTKAKESETATSLHDTSFEIASGNFAGLDTDKYFGEVDKDSGKTRIYNNKGELLEEFEFGSVQGARSSSKYTKNKVKNPLEAWDKRQKENPIAGFKMGEAVIVEPVVAKIIKPANYKSTLNKIAELDDGKPEKSKKVITSYIKESLGIPDEKEVTGLTFGNEIDVGDGSYDIPVTYKGEVYKINIDNITGVEERADRNEGVLNKLIKELATTTTQRIDPSKLVKREKDDFG